MTGYEQHIYKLVFQKYGKADAKKVIEILRNNIYRDICNKMRSAFGQKKGLECYAYIKPSLKKQ